MKITELYFIRHASTLSNLTGSMVKNYDETAILPFDSVDWFEKIGINIYKDNSENPSIWCSNTLRCRQTAEKLFIEEKIHSTHLLSEFDCSSLGTHKFWEITQKEFNALVPITSQIMANQIEDLFRKICLSRYNKIVCISHGMLIRYIYHYVSGNKNIDSYSVINSKGFSFANLDMLQLKLFGNEPDALVSVYRYKKPIDHKS
jgi:broad specificity phosphatase PhoE